MCDHDLHETAILIINNIRPLLYVSNMVGSSMMKLKQC